MPTLLQIRPESQAFPKHRTEGNCAAAPALVFVDDTNAVALSALG
jgi:hypothetical protein